MKKTIKEFIKEEVNLKNIRPVKETVSMQTKSIKNNPVIIGVIGSSGKSTSAYIVYGYLKYLKKRVVLYSTIGVYSPCSVIKNDEACEMSFRSKEDIISILKEANSYNAEYIVIEVNEENIDLINDLKFDIKLLTNININHTNHINYVNKIKEFLNDEESLHIIGFFDYDKSLFEELKVNNALSFSTNYVSTVNSVLPNTHECLLLELKDDLKGMDMLFRLNNEEIRIKTKMIMNYNVFNILGSVLVVNSLNLFNKDSFQDFILNFSIPGRSEVIDGNIIIDTQLSKALEYIKTKKSKENIRVVIGSVGYGYKYWIKEFQNGNHVENRHKYRKYACSLLDGSVKKVYITENDNGKEDVRSICNELKSYLNNTESEVIIDRKEAIKKAVEEMNTEDVLLIIGRGNRRVLVNGEESIKLLQDKEVVREIKNGYK